MKISGTSSSAILTLLLLASGCGGRARTAPPPAKDVTKPRAAPTARSLQKGKEAEEGGVHLPGQDRSYPSEDPRNSPRSDAPALVPAPPASAPAPPARPSSPAGDAAVGGSPSPAAPEPVVAKAEPEPSDFGPPPVPRGEIRFRVQILASVTFNTALRVRDEVEKTVEESVFLEREQGIWKVRVGDLPDSATADGVRRRLAGLGYDDAFVVEARSR